MSKVHDGGNMPNMVTLQGEEDNFFLTLKDRLERIGIDTDVSDGVHILCWHSGPGVECDLVIRPSTSDPYPCEVDCELVLHDLYIPNGSGNWGPKEIEHQVSWLNNPVGEIPQGEPRYWIHVRDVVDMISELFTNLPQGVVDVSGRRCWSHEVMTSELEMLFKRVKAAESKTFQLENLKIFEPKTEPMVSPNRPNLGPLHSACQNAGLNGWHPSVPFRVGLMECIAHQLA
jgi:hypothetical protein